MQLTRFKRHLLCLCIGSVLSWPATTWAAVQRVKYQAASNYLVVETLDDDLFHFEYGTGSGPDIGKAIETTDMICSKSDNVPTDLCKTDFTGPTQFSDNHSGTLETKDVRLQINPSNLFITVIDKTKNNVPLTTVSPSNLQSGGSKGLLFTRTKELDVYGLGQQFVEPGNSDIDWDGRVREGSEFGNVMAGFNGGANGNTQIPIMYAVNGPTNENYAVFLDNKYRHRWDFTNQSQWKVEISKDPTSQIRFYVMTGPDLLNLRKDYMELTGYPLVPPKKMFGLWISEYGYDKWNELENKLQTLHANKFPVDGFVLDLQWFGGIPDVTGKCRMGSLDFDETPFPDPKGTIKNLRDSNGVGIMLIEEAYICKGLPEHGRLQDKGCLVKNRPGDTQPVFLSGFWGSGGMIDYTNDKCSEFLHESERRKLIDAGVIGHWTDLGEPEMFSPQAGYAVGTHADAHNIFNFRWIRGIYQGYSSDNLQQRPFIMSRSGAAGIQRFGAAMWSGDIGSKLENLAAQAANQMHMSFSGIDYYGSDIGGFHRGGIQNDPNRLNELYTQWHAFGMMFDIPGRPHTENLCNCKETAPDRIGDLRSNLENTRQRYELIPYVYSLAHRAYRTGDPVVPPLVVYYQTDKNVRNIGHEKMIGRDLLAAIVAKQGETERDVYLPAGTWFDWHTNERINSTGVFIPKVPVYRNGVFKLPLYAREGAIIPLAFVDENTMNAVGKRKDNSTHNELIVKVFTFDSKSGVNSFTLYEDDGTTIAYQKGAVRTTEISQKRTGDELTVGVNKSEGTYEGAPASRNNVIKLVTKDTVKKVALNDSELKEFSNLDDFNKVSSGWINAGNNTVIAKSGDMSVSDAKQFVVTLVPPPPCTSKYSAISVPGEGNRWNPADPARTLNCEGNVWKGRIKLSSEQYKFAANGSWHINWGCDGKQNGPNCPPRAEGPGTYDVAFKEDDPANPKFKLVIPDDGRVSARFICEKGFTTPGISVYVAGSIPELGTWKPADPNVKKLEPNGPYPTWTGLISNLPPNTKIEWKCIKREEEGDQRVIEWQPDPNNVFTTPASGIAPDQKGTF